MGTPLSPTALSDPLERKLSSRVGPARTSTALGACRSELAASKTSSTSGHSYCSSGGTSGEQRVLLYCHEYWDPSDIYFVYGPWVVAKNWSAASCHAGDTADQASYVTSP